MTEKHYTAKDIRVLGDDEAADMTERLHLRCPGYAVDFIKRLVEASLVSGWPLEKAEARYLAKVEGAEPAPAEFQVAHMEAQLVASRGYGLRGVEL